MVGARGFIGDLDRCFLSFSLTHVCNAGFIARLAGHFIMTQSRNLTLLRVYPVELQLREELTCIKNYKTTNEFEDLFSVCFGMAFDSNEIIP